MWMYVCTDYVSNIILDVYICTYLCVVPPLYIQSLILLFQIYYNMLRILFVHSLTLFPMRDSHIFHIIYSRLRILSFM